MLCTEESYKVINYFSIIFINYFKVRLRKTYWLSHTAKSDYAQICQIMWTISIYYLLRGLRLSQPELTQLLDMEYSYFSLECYIIQAVRNPGSTGFLGWYHTNFKQYNSLKWRLNSDVIIQSESLCLRGLALVGMKHMGVDCLCHFTGYYKTLLPSVIVIVL